MAVAVAGLLTVLGLLTYALGLPRHHRQVFGGAPAARRSRLFASFGVALILIAPTPWIIERGPSMAGVTWLFCGTPLAGLVVASLFTGLERRAARRAQPPPGSRTANRPSASR